MSDPVNHPAHYATHPSGVEVIEFTRHLNFNLGNAVKYICRHQLKGKPRQDIEKAIWYLNDEIERVALGTVYEFDVPLEAVFAVGLYLGTEAYLIENDPDKATLTIEQCEVVARIFKGNLQNARDRLQRGLEGLA